MTEPRMFEAACPECGATLHIPEADLIGLWEGENVGGGRWEHDFEVACRHCGHKAFVSGLEIETLTPSGEV